MPASAHAARPVRRVLLVSLDNLGDLVFASALSEPLSRRFPDAELTVWCKHYTADVAPLLPGVHRVIAADPFWDVAPGRGKGALGDFARALRDVRAHRFDVAVLASPQWRVAAAAWAAGIPRRVGLERAHNHRFLTDVLPPASRDRSVLGDLVRMLAPLGAAPTDDPPRYRLDARPLAERVGRLRGALGRAPLAALHAFASKRARCIPLDQWLRLAAAVEERGFAPLWVGTAQELAEVRASAPAGNAWRYLTDVGDGTLADAAAAISTCRLFVGHDSGPLHVAGGFGVPVVGIFAPGTPNRTYPQGTGPGRMLYRPSPDDITLGDVLPLVDDVLGEAARGG